MRTIGHTELKSSLTEEQLKALLEKSEEDRSGNTEKLFYSVCELQSVLGIGKNAALQLVKAEGFPYIRIGLKYYIPIQHFKEWTEKNLRKEIKINTHPKEGRKRKEL